MFATDFLSANSHSIHLAISCIKNISVNDILTGMTNIINENVVKYINVKCNAITTVKPQITSSIRGPLF